MKTFLQQVADYYIRNSIDLSKYTFVFPNKRSAMFMRKYLKDGYTATRFMPRLTTITAFTQQYCPVPLASSTELLFVLYNAYCKVLLDHDRESQIKDFDSFVFWGNVLLRDFNDVDAYLVNAPQLFLNLKNVKEISANYLTDEQIEVAKLLGAHFDKNDITDFWKHVPSDPAAADVSSKFISLWQILNDLYDAFCSMLREHDIAYSGKQSKQAYYTINEMNADDFGGEKIAFVGFSVLSTSRLMMFKRLRDLGVADFFWDVASPMLHVKGNKAGAMVLPLAKEFPAPEGFVLDKIADMPHFDIYPISSNVGQAKVASSILSEWASQGGDSVNSTVTGLVLPDEKMLMPVLHSIAPEIKPLNVAMRVSFADTPFANFMSSILYMHDNCRIVRGEAVFFYKDVMEVLSHPYIKLIDAPASKGNTQSEALTQAIVTQHIYNVPSLTIVIDYPALAFIFGTVANAGDVAEVKTFIDGLLSTFESVIKQKVGESHSKDTYELKIIADYRRKSDEIFALTDRYAIKMHEHTYFTLLRKLIYSIDLKFNGDPVRGLQIMGMRDSRVLDFDNLVILSLNERMLPKKSYTLSLIPLPLRGGFGMPTPDNEEINQAYQFYRLISRAKRLAFVYDSRTPELTSGEMSRYLSQLKYALPAHFTTKSIKAGLSIGESRQIAIDKDDKVMAELQEFKPGGRFNLSASAMKNYICCPLKFYLQHVKRIRIEDFDPEYVDSASFGTVFHKVAEIFYTERKQRYGERFFDNALIDEILAEKDLHEKLTQLAMRIIDEEYYHMGLTDMSKLPGEGRVLSRLIASYMIKMLECEKGIPPYIFLKGEENLGSKRHTWKIDDTHSINFTLSIDRIDKLDPEGRALRFIDYKTGGDEISFPSVEDLFTNHKRGAIFQILLYCMAYCDITGTDRPITPLIYKISKLGDDGIKNISSNRKPVSDFHQIDKQEPNSLSDEMRRRLIVMIDEIFDPDIPFGQTQDDENCKYCAFASICRRFVKENDN